VWLVELAPLSEEAIVPKAVAGTLDVPERPKEQLTHTLADVLRDREMLLILDNCEHLVEATARFVDLMLDSCPGLRNDPYIGRHAEVVARHHEQSGGNVEPNP
jgi:predicted ATPase